MNNDNLFLNPPHKEKYKHEDKNQPETAAWVVSPFFAMRPCWQSSDKYKNQYAYE